MGHSLHCTSVSLLVHRVLYILWVCAKDNINHWSIRQSGFTALEVLSALPVHPLLSPAPGVESIITLERITLKDPGVWKSVVLKF